MPEKLTKHRLNSVYAKPAHSIVGRAAGTNGAQARAPGRAAGASQLAIRRAAAAIRRQRRKRGPTFQPAPLSVRSSSPGFPDSASEPRRPTRPRNGRCLREARVQCRMMNPWPVLSPHWHDPGSCGPARVFRPAALSGPGPASRAFGHPRRHAWGPAPVLVIKVGRGPGVTSA